MVAHLGRRWYASSYEITGALPGASIKTMWDAGRVTERVRRNGNYVQVVSVSCTEAEGSENESDNLVSIGIVCLPIC